MYNHCALVVLFSLTFLPLEKLISQIDTVAFEDSLAMNPKMENLLEQNVEVEDSPLLDYLENKKVRQASYIQLRSRIIQRLEPSAGYQDDGYVGSRIKSYQRIKFSQWNHYSGGVIFEKDAGEKRFTDFVTGNLTISNYGALSKLVLGDYFVEAGQGIALWRSYDVSKGADVIIPVKRAASGLSPYLSTGENNFFRGVAAELKLGNIIPTIFYSDLLRSGSLDSEGYVSSFYDLGYYRTSNEISKRNAVNEKIFGARGCYNFHTLGSVGLTFFKSSYSRNILLDGGRKFSGNKYSVVSVDYNLSLSTTTLFGELTGSNGRIAGSSGLLINPHGVAKLIVAGRYYPQQLISLHGLGFGENISNEKGFYVGLQFQPIRDISISSYYDQYQSLERNTISFPSAENDLLTQVEISPVKNLDVAIRYHRKVKNISETITDVNRFNSDVIGRQYKHNVRLNMDYKVSTKVSLRARFEQLYLQSNTLRKNEKGFLTYQEIMFQPTHKLWSNARIIYFRSDSYYSGIFEYERDLDGVLTQPILYGSGIRWYFMMKYELINNLKLAVKYSDYIRDDVKRIGTGLDELPSNRDNRLGLQIDLKL